MENEVMENEAKEIVLLGRHFMPSIIPADAVVRCAHCELIDPTRLGHLPSDCHLALREEVQRLNALLKIPSQRAGSEGPAK